MGNCMAAGVWGQHGVIRVSWNTHGYSMGHEGSAVVIMNERAKGNAQVNAQRFLRESSWVTMGTDGNSHVLGVRPSTDGIARMEV